MSIKIDVDMGKMDLNGCFGYAPIPIGKCPLQSLQKKFDVGGEKVAVIADLASGSGPTAKNPSWIMKYANWLTVHWIEMKY